ncbi:MAG: hypothetical protein RH948_19080 [Cyclobacteriaceae bacterium]
MIEVEFYNDRSYKLLDIINGLQLQIEASGGMDVGLIAQEVEELFPEIVAENDEGFKTVAYYKLIPLLIETVKDQEKTIDNLKMQLDTYSDLVKELREIKERVNRLESK